MVSALEAEAWKSKRSPEFYRYCVTAVTAAMPVAPPDLSFVDSDTWVLAAGVVANGRPYSLVYDYRDSTFSAFETTSASTMRRNAVSVHVKRRLARHERFEEALAATFGRLLSPDIQWKTLRVAPRASVRLRRVLGAAVVQQANGALVVATPDGVGWAWECIASGRVLMALPQGIGAEVITVAGESGVATRWFPLTAASLNHWVIEFTASLDHIARAVASLSWIDSRSATDRRDQPGR